MSVCLFLLKSLISGSVTFYYWVHGNLGFIGGLVKNLWERWKNQVTVYHISTVELKSGVLTS